MSARREYALTVLLPLLEIIELPRPIDLRKILGLHQVIIDFGSGMGDHTLELAQAQSNVGILAIDVHTAGLCEVAQSAHDLSLTNIRTHHGDGIDVLRDWLTPGSISEIHVLFPDPWPKIRHNKRRLIQQSFLDLAAIALEPGGIFHCVTDDVTYYQQAMSAFELNSNFNVDLSDWEIPMTSYHRRAIRLGHTISHLSFRKLITS